jgi:hypothetical protein
LNEEELERIAQETQFVNQRICSAVGNESGEFLPVSGIELLLA